MAVHHNNPCIHGRKQSCRCEFIKRSLFGIGPRLCKYFPMGDYARCSHYEMPPRPKCRPPGQKSNEKKYLEEIRELSTDELLTHENETLRAVGKRIHKENSQEKVYYGKRNELEVHCFARQAIILKDKASPPKAK